MATRIGEMACTNPKCSCADVAVEVTGAGTWQAKCHRCGKPTFGKSGTKWRRDMEALVKLDEGGPEPKPKPDVKPEPRPVPAVPPKGRANNPFSLENL